MQHKVFYAPVSEAIEKLRSQGYVLDFNAEGSHLVCNGKRFHAGDFEVGDIYRYEGDSDPGDEAIVYAITSVSGEKGVLVSSYGMDDDISPELLKKLHF